MKPITCWTRMFIALLIATVIGMAAPNGLGQNYTGNADQATHNAAVFLLKSAVRTDQRGEQHSMLLALRQLRDPALSPLFEHLTHSNHPSFQIHGILGLAESSAKRQIDLVWLTQITDPMVQAELVAAAMDSDVLNDEQLMQLLGWPDLDAAVRVIAAGPLVSRGKLRDGHALQEARTAENLARRSMAALVLTQIGDASGPRLLDALDESDDPKRPSIIQMILKSAIRYEFDTIGPWATKWASDSSLSRKLRTLALQTSLRLSDPAGVTYWRQQFDSTTDAAARLRLALCALRASPWLTPEFFDPLLQIDGQTDTTSSLIVAMGRAGHAVASGRHVPDAVLALMQHGYALADQWIIAYAQQEYANADDATVILKGLIESFNANNQPQSPQQVDHVVSASAALAGRDPQTAISVLHPILADPASNSFQKQAILLGLLRITTGDLLGVLPTDAELDDNETIMLGTLLAARHGGNLNDDQLKKLGLVARGGGSFPAALRVQAAWLYLIRTGQADDTLASLLKSL